MCGRFKYSLMQGEGKKKKKNPLNQNDSNGNECDGKYQQK